jgi:NADP-dependent 3-hydroxy acid dehydrogenase YdfG
MKKVHVITGGSSGIGLECAKLFKEGTVVIASRGEDKLITASEELNNIGIDVEYYSTDVSDKESVKKLIDYAKSFGELKTMVHAAGVSGTVGDVMKTLKIDLLGTYNVV